LVFAAAATVTLLGGAFADDGATFTRTPASGPDTAPITTASVTPCPTSPPEPTQPGYHNDPELGLAVIWFLDDIGPVDEFAADSETGEWAGEVNIEGIEPGTYMLRAECARYIFCAEEDLPEGQHCLPRGDYATGYYPYVPQEYTVCEDGQTTCATESTTTTTTTTTSSSTTTSTTVLPGTTTTTSTTVAPGTTTTSTTAPPGPTTTAPPGTTTTAPGLARRNPDGAASTSSATAAPGSTLTVSGSGFMPGSTVQGIVFSTPQSLGSATANAAGTVSMTVQLPSDLPAGVHELQLQGVNPQNQSRTLSANVTVGLVRTGTDPLALVLLAFGLLAAGFALLRARGSRYGTHFTR
jgi:hypothetical protein